MGLMPLLYRMLTILVIFFFQAEDGIRDLTVTGVQTCALPISIERELVEALKTLDARAVPIAAICAATTVAARVGLLGGRRHTSNGLDYLKQHVPDYTGSSMYVDAPAVRDRGLITASGLADVEFAQEIMAELGVLSDSDRAYWTSLFRGGRLRSGAA